MLGEDLIDARLVKDLAQETSRLARTCFDAIPRACSVVLVGQRAAGKSALAPLVAKHLGRALVDLDAEMAKRAGRDLRSWFEADVTGFRRAEASVFSSLPVGCVVAAGGGFAQNHPGLLRGTLAVEVPVSFDTYRERLLRDSSRPRLMPAVSLEEELRQVFERRKDAHSSLGLMSWPQFAVRLTNGQRPRRVVTLPPGVDALTFSRAALAAGAELLEVRSDLVNTPVESALPVLAAERSAALHERLRAAATLVDCEEGSHSTSSLMSRHLSAPLSPAQALALWKDVSPETFVKHVEPLGVPSESARLLETQALLIERFGAHRVTVLATSPWALPIRAVLAKRNALDYLALDANFSAAKGQRLVADAAREYQKPPRGDGLRLGILGEGLAHSRSPRLHAQPFDRIDWEGDAPLPSLLDALRPHYAGFAVTAPFKKPVAQHLGSALGAVNTLVRDGQAWRAYNTDLAGARAVLERLGAKSFTILGDGGAAFALREAAKELGVFHSTLRARDVEGLTLDGDAVWTWPLSHLPPPSFRFARGRVALVTYGPPARRLAHDIRLRGGQPLALGAKWFVAQAREQARLFSAAR